ncbi:MAG: flagellar biosynthetic protein FliO [Colwellia sp.]|nr:flagellar biosynthetic protein FliO [Colwellia sp.]
MKKFILLLIFSWCFLAQGSLAQGFFTQGSFIQSSFIQGNAAVTNSAQLEEDPKASPSITGKYSPQVGKHVMANMDASSMILSLLMVLALIIISALVLKRFNLTQQNTKQLNVVASLSLGAKERLVVVQIGEQQLVLGVCPQQVSLLKSLEKPLDIQTNKPLALSGNVLSFLQKNSLETTANSTDANSNSATSETTSRK